MASTKPRFIPVSARKWTTDSAEKALYMLAQPAGIRLLTIVLLKRSSASDGPLKLQTIPPLACSLMMEETFPFIHTPWHDMQTIINGVFKRADGATLLRLFWASRAVYSRRFSAQSRQPFRHSPDFP
jgi:hypothetical protein